MNEKEEAAKLAALAPKLTDKELAEANRQYQSYIFRRNRTRELWTSCCGRHEKVPVECSDKLYEIMTGAHQPETEYQPDPYLPGAHKRPAQKSTVTCPYCGTKGYLKELGRTGSRDNIAEVQRFVFLRWYRGALWAMAYQSIKKYGDSLTAPPKMWLRKIYRFKPGEALQVSPACWWSDNPQFDYVTRLTGRPKKLPLCIYEPFPYDDVYGSGFILIGLDEIEKSPFKYCGYKEFWKTHPLFMRYLAVCCIYPRQVEMLMKAGMSGAVEDLAYNNKWNAASFDWNKEDPLLSFGLNKTEMKEFLVGAKNLDVLKYYKQFRRQKIKCGIADAEQLIGYAPDGKIPQVVKRLKELRIEPVKWMTYIDRELDVANSKKQKPACHGHIPIRIKVRDLAQYWLDYLHDSVTVGSDLTNPLIQTPKDLSKRHDDIVAAAEVVRAAQRAEAERRMTEEQKRKDEELREKAVGRLAECNNRYAYEYGEYIIRPPVDALEIAAEGKALKHCVGGYAERHIFGTLAILFLRKASAPDTPLVTIEMSGSKLVQIHGFENDRTAKVLPREKYAEILEPWLEWVQAGSKRDKQGKPIQPKKKQERVKVALAAAG